MASKQGYNPDLKRYMDKRLEVSLNGKRKITGIMIGHDHFMNIVLDQAQEHVGKEYRPIGRVMIRGNSMIMWECKDKI
jgi:small nuclear ribonucleoprotein G